MPIDPTKGSGVKGASSTFPENHLEFAISTVGPLQPKLQKPFALLTLIIRQGRESEATEAFFFPIGEKRLFIPGCVQRAII